MDICIITCQWAYNYGAVLQAYALCKHLQDAGHTVRLINYKPSYRRGIPTSGIKRVLKPLIRFPDWLKGAKTFDSFLQTHTPLESEPRETLLALEQSENDCDAYIVGSDQVWAFHMPNGYDNAYYLDFAPQGAKRLSYAASIASCEITNAQKSHLKDKLSSFSAISVREKSGKKLLDDIGLPNVTVTTDPVFLLSAQQWGSLLKNHLNHAGEEYILLYCFSRPERIYEQAKLLAKKRNCKLYCVGTFWEDRFFSQADKTFWNCPPEEFVSLIANASCVVTNSFHGVAFSIIFEKEFYAFAKNMPEDTRLFDLLDELNLSHCIVKDTITETHASADKGTLEKNINLSKQFLNDNLG